MQYGYLVVEGPHDIEFVGRLLRLYDFRRVQYLSRLDPFWRGIIPDKFPVEDNLLKRVPVPVFFQSPTHSVAVHSAIGDTNLINTLEETLVVLDTGIEGVGLLLDADTSSASARFSNIAKELVSRTTLTAPDAPGAISTGAPRVGIYVLPDNQAAGTLEDLLLECAQVSYTSLEIQARAYINSVDQSVLTKYDLDDFRKPAGKKKSVVSAIASVLKPGKSIQVSIQDNRWVAGDALLLPRVGSLQSFLAELLRIS